MTSILINASFRLFSYSSFSIGGRGGTAIISSFVVVVPVVVVVVVLVVVVVVVVVVLVVVVVEVVVGKQSQFSPKLISSLLCKRV